MTKLDVTFVKKKEKKGEIGKAVVFLKKGGKFFNKESSFFKKVQNYVFLFSPSNLAIKKSIFVVFFLWKCIKNFAHHTLHSKVACYFFKKGIKKLCIVEHPTMKKKIKKHK